MHAHCELVTPGFVAQPDLWLCDRSWNPDAARGAA